MQLLLGTKNKGKIKEIRKILSDIDSIELLTFEDVPFGEVLEDGKTFRANAKKKATQISQETGFPTLAEDSGLEVDSLDGAPGIETARYAGPNATDQQRIDKLLKELTNEANRSAQFRCCAALVVPKDGEWVGEGILTGSIANEPKGIGGFGYDPIFIPDGESGTLAELSDEIKNSISHRRRAIEALKEPLRRIASVKD